MADPILEEKNILDQFMIALRGATQATGQLATATKNAKVALDAGKVALENAYKANKGNATAIRDEIKAYEELVKKLNKATKEQERFENAVEILTRKAKPLSDSLKQVSSGLQSFTGQITKAMGFLGVAGFSFDKLAEHGLKYNRTLFEIQKTQIAAGKGATNMSQTLQYVKKNTNLSQMQFAEFAKVVTGSFIGVRMSLKEVADLSILLAKTAGPSLEAQTEAAKELASVQSEFPSLYSKIKEGLELVAKINADPSNTKAEKAHLAVLRDEIQMTQQLNGDTSARQTKTREYLTEWADGMDKLMETEKKHQEMSQAADNAKTEFFKALEPLLKMAYEFGTKALKVFSEYKEVFLTLAVGIPILTKIVTVGASIRKVMGGIGMAGKAMGLLKLANPWMLALTAATALYGIYSRYKRKQEESGKDLVKQKELMIANSEIKAKEIGLLPAQRVEYEKLNAVGLKGVESEEEKISIKTQNLNKVKTQITEEKQLLNAQILIKAEMEAQIKILGSMKGGYQAMVDVAKEFGMVNDQALLGLIASSKLMKNALEKDLSGAMETVVNEMQKIGKPIKINAELDIEAGSQDLMKQLSVIRETVKTTKEKENIDKKISFLSERTGKVTKASGDIAKSMIGVDEARVKQQEEMTSSYEARLNTERQLMEAAQFGMGASVSMMTKQVDLADELKKGYDGQIKTMQTRMENEMGLSKEQIKQIQNSRTQAEAEAYINTLGIKDGDNKKYIIKNAQIYQDLTKKSMEQQMKIYELTKNIREGYLDAITEMATGAGEFTKIIGTQESGTTQLMSIVDKFAKGALNTMKLGGQQDESLSRAGVGTTTVGKFTTKGAEFSQVEQEQMNARLYGYDKSVKNVMSGGSKVGTGVTPEVEKFTGEIAERTGTYSQTITPLDVMQKEYKIMEEKSLAKRAMRGQGPLNAARESGHTFGTNEKMPNAVQFGADLTRGSKAPPPLSPDKVGARLPSSGNPPVSSAIVIPPQSGINTRNTSSGIDMSEIAKGGVSGIVKVDVSLSQELSGILSSHGNVIAGLTQAVKSKSII